MNPANYSNIRIISPSLPSDFDNLVFATTEIYYLYP